jgi:hypothetical protein
MCMKKLKIYFPLILVLFIYNSCGVSGPQINLYGPAMYSSDVSYQPKPMASDSMHHAGYVSLSYLSVDAPNDNNSFDMITGELINIGQGYTFDNFNLSYGAFAAIGSYSDQTIHAGQPNYFNSKSFGNVGGRFSANAFVTSGHVDIRFMGIEMAYSHEFGDYADFRKSIAGQPNFFTDTRTDIVTIGGSSEVIWHGSRKLRQYGFRLFLGRTIGDNTYRSAAAPNELYYPQTNTFSLAYFMQVKKVFFVAEFYTNGVEYKAGLRF